VVLLLLGEEAVFAGLVAVSGCALLPSCSSAAVAGRFCNEVACCVAADDGKLATAACMQLLLL
jgi:hypothetical protein